MKVKLTKKATKRPSAREVELVQLVEKLAFEARTLRQNKSLYLDLLVQDLTEAILTSADTQTSKLAYVTLITELGKIMEQITNEI